MHDNGQPEPAYQEFLSRPIRDLGLKLEGSPVERFVEQLYRELDAKGLTKFRPACYLTDEWGCPSGEPIIGIPFYLAHAALSELVWTVSPAVSRELSARAVFARLRPPFAGLVCAEASGRGFC